MQDGLSGHGPASGRLAALHSYWLTKRAGEAVPLRGAIDPTEIPNLLPHIMLIDVEQPDQAPPRFRFRLTGTGLVDVFGQDPTGRYLDEPGWCRDADALLVPLRQAVALAAPVASAGRLAWDNGASVDIEWLFLPLGAGGAAVTIILAGADFSSPSLQYPAGEPRIELTTAAEG